MSCLKKGVLYTLVLLMQCLARHQKAVVGWNFHLQCIPVDCGGNCLLTVHMTIVCYAGSFECVLVNALTLLSQQTLLGQQLVNTSCWYRMLTLDFCFRKIVVMDKVY